jgi:starvation-inducible outer membrane lipoprotein
MPAVIFIKLGICIMAPEPISKEYFINPSHQSVSLYVYPPVVARQRLGKIVTATTNTQKTIEELLDASFSMQSMSYQMKVGD